MRAMVSQGLTRAVKKAKGSRVESRRIKVSQEVSRRVKYSQESQG